MIAETDTSEANLHCAVAAELSDRGVGVGDAETVGLEGWVGNRHVKNRRERQWGLK